MGRRVTKSMSSKLTSVFLAEEVKVALKQMHLTKAPRLDGMPLLFYQQYWHIVGSSVTKAILHYFNSSQIPSELNHTFITLIPKKKILKK